MGVHVASSEMRSVRGAGLEFRFAALGDVVYLLADVPAAGSAGTVLEDPCVKPHWGIILDGELEVERGRRRNRLGAGTAFHVPGGEPSHRFCVSGAARLAGFEPIDGEFDLSEERLRELGFEPGAADGGKSAASLAPPAADLAQIESGRIEATAMAMGPLVLVRAQFGPESGYATEPCRLPHWGLVTSGTLILEFEDGAEILGPGDAYACPAGPPGHRFLAADPASIIDYTPLAALAGEAAVADWRREVMRRLGGRRRATEAVAIARI